MLTVRVRGVPFPIEFADWTKGPLMENIEKRIKDFVAELVDDIRTELVTFVSSGLLARPRTSGAPSEAYLQTMRNPGPSAKRLLSPGARVQAESRVGPARRKGPIQLCPVPGCKERAAPVYGMVCAKHKATPKAKIAKFREARRKKAKK